MRKNWWREGGGRLNERVAGVDTSQYKPNGCGGRLRIAEPWVGGFRLLDIADHGPRRPTAASQLPGRGPAPELRAA